MKVASMTATATSHGLFGVGGKLSCTEGILFSRPQVFRSKERCPSRPEGLLVQVCCRGLIPRQRDMGHPFQ